MDERILDEVPSDWRPPTHFPNLQTASAISFDLETKDPGLEENGPGAIRKEGYVIGFSMATDEGFKAYYPIRHPCDNVENPEQAISWAKDQLKTDIPKIGANILYDMLWAKCDLDIDIGGAKYDVQVAEPLLDENQRTFALDALGVKWCNEHKDEGLLLKAGLELLKLKPIIRGSTEPTLENQKKSIMKQVKGKLWQLPARYVGPYGEQDADLPFRIFEKQKKQLQAEDIWRIFLIEAEVLDLLFEMQMKGVPIDEDRAEIVAKQLDQELSSLLRNLRHRCGSDIDIWSNESIAKACTKLGLSYPVTAKDNPSFVAKWLNSQENAFFKLLAEARSVDRSGSVFIQKKLLDLSVNGRIHPQFWQVKNDRGGTGSGRFASSNPNAQQFPARNERMAKLIRSLIIPEPGCEWYCADYKQQEPRVTVHYGAICNMPGADIARKKYIEDPTTDYHQMTAGIANIERKPAKTINLGLTYGMGKKKLASELGLPYDEATLLFAKYHAALPYIDALSKTASKLAGERGFIRTIMGRKKHFDMWGPPFGYVMPSAVRKKLGILPDVERPVARPFKHDKALEIYGPCIQRWGLHKALNALIQGSSADMTKVAMVLCRRLLGAVPHMTIHDENDYSIETRKQAKEIYTIMVNDTTELLGMTVPLDVDNEIGPNWGNLTKIPVSDLV